MSTFIEIIVQGMGIGALYLLGALGLSIVYGVMGVVNLAHGEFMMLGAYAVVVLAPTLTYFGAAVAATVLLVLVGLFVQGSLVRFVVGNPVASMLATAGLAIALRQAITIIFGPNLKYVGMPLEGSTTLPFGVELVHWRALLILAAAAVAIGVATLIARSGFGLKMRAVIANPEIAQSLGLRASRVNLATFAIGAGIAGLAGALIAPLTTVSPNMGLTFLVGSFLVVILAGLGSIRATVAWSVAVGVGTAAVAIPFNSIIGQIAVWSVALLIVAFRRDALVAARV